MIRKTGDLVPIALLLLALLFPAQSLAKNRTIGVLIFSEETRYTDATKGILDTLRNAGYREPQTNFIIENAGANKAKAAELVQKFAASKMDLIFTLGTSATIAVAREIKDLPIVFSMVYDPVEAGIVKDWKSSGNNITGTSTKLPMARLIEILKAFAPVKKLAVLYSPGERNSELQLKDLQELQNAWSIKVMPVPLSRKEEVAQLLPDIIRVSDAIFVSGSNLVDGQVSFISELAAKGKVPTITHLPDLVQKGVLLGVCPDPYLLGAMAGEKAIRILKGAKPSSIPIDSTREYQIMLNMDTARAGQFKITPEFMGRVKKKIN